MKTRLISTMKTRLISYPYTNQRDKRTSTNMSTVTHISGKCLHILQPKIKLERCEYHSHPSLGCRART